MTSSPPASSAVPVSEWFVRWSPSLGVIAALSLGLSLVAVLFNPAWTDEVFYVEPGASLAFGEGFLSNGISHLGYGATWGLSNPGAPLLLAGWFKSSSSSSVPSCSRAGSGSDIRWAGRQPLPWWRSA